MSQNLVEMDQGQSRNKKYTTPRLTHGFLLGWPSYNILLQADKMSKKGKVEYMTVIKSRLLASYSLIPETCTGNKCHRMREKRILSFFLHAH